jgi:exonuclease III
MDMRFGTWNIRSLYRAGLLMTVAKEISKCKLDLVVVQEVRWDRGGTEPTGFTASVQNRNSCSHNLNVSVKKAASSLLLAWLILRPLRWS